MDVLRFTFGEGLLLFCFGVAAASDAAACAVGAALGKKAMAVAFGVLSVAFITVAIVILVTANHVAGGG
jgi:hypothetical protein